MTLPAERGSRTWGLRPAVLIVGAAAAAGCLVWLLIARSAEDELVASVALGAFTLATVLSLPMRRRLSIDQEGFTVRSAVGSRRFAWSQVVRVAAPTRRRRGLASTTLEIDLDDEGLVVLGQLELGTDPIEVAAVLQNYARLR